MCLVVFRSVVAIRGIAVPLLLTRRPGTAVSQRDRRGEYGRGGLVGQPHGVALLRGRLAQAHRHVVARRPHVADELGRVRTAARPFVVHPSSDGQPPRPVHVPGVQRPWQGRVVEHYAPGVRHRVRRRPDGQPVPGAAAQTSDQRRRDPAQAGRRQARPAASHL